MEHKENPEQVDESTQEKVDGFSNLDKITRWIGIASSLVVFNLAACRVHSYCPPCTFTSFAGKKVGIKRKPIRVSKEEYERIIKGENLKISIETLNEQMLKNMYMIRGYLAKLIQLHYKDPNNKEYRKEILHLKKQLKMMSEYLKGVKKKHPGFAYILDYVHFNIDTLLKVKLKK